MLPNANDQTSPGEAGQTTAQATAAAGRSDQRDERALAIGAVPAAAGATSESAPAAVLASASLPVGAGGETRIGQAPGLVTTAAARYAGEDSKAALAAQAVVLKQMQAPPADDAPQLRPVDLPADAVVAVATAAAGAGAEPAGNTGDAPDRSDAT
ncbi:MAG: hypothetical protein ABWZ08_14135 [Pseudoxanthomonas sp.]